MNTRKTPNAVCLNCKEIVECATSVNSDCGPIPGAISICLYCGHVMAFTDNLSLRQLTDEEMYDVAGDPIILEIQRMRIEMVDDKKEK